MLQFLIFIVHFHVFDGAGYPFKLSRPIPLDRFHIETMGCFTITALSMEGEGGPSTGCQTHSNA